MTTHDLAHERALLGGIVRTHGEALDEVGALEGCWYQAEHERLYALLCARQRAGEPIDQVTIPEAVSHLGAERFGGVAYVASLPGHCVSPTNLGHYAARVRDLSVVRRAGALLDEAREQVEAGGPAAVEELAARLLETVVDGDPGAAPPVGEWAEGELAELLESPDHIPTGLEALDEAIGGGVGRGKLIILCGRPAMGKSALLETVEWGMVRKGHPVASCVLEGGRRLRYMRQLSRMSHVPLFALVARDLRQGQHEALVRAARDLRTGSRMQPYPWHWMCRTGLTPADVSQHARRVRRAHGGRLGAVTVDYVQLMRRPGGNRREGLGQVVNALSDLAVSMDVPVLVVAQLNRQVEARENKRPRLSDLHEAGELEMAADTVVGLFRPAYYSETADEDVVEALVLKQRSGRTGTVLLGWDGARVRMHDRPVYDHGEEM